MLSGEFLRIVESCRDDPKRTYGFTLTDQANKLLDIDLKVLSEDAKKALNRSIFIECLIRLFHKKLLEDSNEQLKKSADEALNAEAEK